MAIPKHKSFFEWLAYVEAHAPTTRVGRKMTARNYTISHTGGGCLVWERMIDNGIDKPTHYLWICDQGNGLGSKINEEYLVGVYDGEGNFDCATCANLNDAIEWCEARVDDPDQFIAAFNAPDAPETIDDLIEVYADWNREQGLKLGSADEHLFDESLTEEQHKWLHDFCRRWENAETEERERKAIERRFQEEEASR